MSVMNSDLFDDDLLHGVRIFHEKTRLMQALIELQDRNMFQPKVQVSKDPSF